MGQGILDQVEHLAVEFGVGAVHLQFDLLAEFAGQVAHDPRQLLPGIADRLHPRLHDAFLQLGGDVGQPLQRHLELGILVAPRDLQQLVARQNQFRHHRHQMFQRVHIDADRLVGDLVGFLNFHLNDRFAGRRFGRGDDGGSALSRGRSYRGRRFRRRNLGGGFAERALQLIQRHFAGTQLPLQYLRHQGALLDRRCIGVRSSRRRRDRRSRR